MTTQARRRTTLVALTAAMLAGFFFTTGAPPADAAISSVEREVVRWINADRVALGLRPFQVWGKLASVAELRAERMASANVMSHTISGSLSRQLTAAGARWYGYGENIAYTTYPRGIDAARRIYTLWKRSSVHWAQITSRKFNYVGLGLAYRSSNGRTFASLVFTESPDHTGPRAAITSAARKSADLTWTWRGSDVPLQTHTAGFRDFDVQYRIDGGTWRLARDNTTSTSLTVLDRQGGHTYGLRVRGRDKAGNVGAWSPESRLSVP